MSPDRWQQIDAVFQAAAELTKQERAAYLERACNGDAELRREVESLLAFDETGAGALTSAVVDAQESLKASEHEGIIGRRVGVYRITGMVGSGGMGTVYSAVRDDDAYQQHVAVKIVKRGMDTDFVLNRFRHERQILASLENPRIARLLDGGTTADGRPYLVMEFIEGLPITHYCRNKNLSVQDRLKLFRLVCSAVQYAHQKLVVHRDLKPSNILVTDEGVPKLLDFGIAKLLNPDQTAPMTEYTSVTQRLMTPDYASPEQVRGESVGTASDIYSLGAILYEILTGQKPHQFKNRSTSEIERAICQTETERPSTAVRRVNENPARLHRQLAGDLDNVVLMAMRKEPERRYASVEQFSEDIRRHLEGLPVIARKDTFTYRTSKFLQRHKFGVFAAVLVAVSLVGGIVATTYQARRAERRFQQVRKLANSFVFNVYDRIEHLPGALPARELVVKTALEYLDSLASEARGDASLQRELADAYVRVGDVQGHVNTSNLGSTAGALASYIKARDISQAVLNEDPRDIAAKRTVARALTRIADMLASRGKLKDGIETYKQAIRIQQELVTQNPSNKDDLRAVAKSHRNVSTLMNRAFDTQGALENARLSRGILEELTAASNPTNELLHELSSVYVSLGLMLHRANDRGGALENFEKSKALRLMTSTSDPNNLSYRHDLMIVYGHMGDAYRNGRQDEESRARALENYEKALAIAEKTLAEDPKDRRAQLDYASALLRVGTSTPESEPARALIALRGSTEMMEKLSDLDPKNERLRVNLAFLQLRIAERLLAQKDTGAADKGFRRAIEMSEALQRADPKDMDHSLMLLRAYDAAAIGMAKMGDRATAVDWGSRLIKLGELVAAQHNDSIAALSWKPRAYASMGGVLDQTGDQEESQGWYEKSAQAWDALRSHSGFNASYQAEAADASAKLGEMSNSAERAANHAKRSR